MLQRQQSTATAKPSQAARAAQAAQPAQVSREDRTRQPQEPAAKKSWARNASGRLQSGSVNEVDASDTDSDNDSIDRQRCAPKRPSSS
ncbi:hypothetical protein J8273_2612 [Carpediemonas membranifera]|uniref:Uncharacterized protein n=1 Tax=Carpediemonas membranifera TaxID=201153 RepID=A0A8J6B5S7_9EUKA|nr:hypothetical protein J8273_2612 [Carpediemonas membranifera]|eukprot:KAG9396258.1 hypothetical protein J8273_2612 [Carpediemonas membranifera]